VNPYERAGECQGYRNSSYHHKLTIGRNNHTPLAPNRGESLQLSCLPATSGGTSLGLDLMKTGQRGLYLVGSQSYGRTV
jgi:hypothetical protein